MEYSQHLEFSSIKKIIDDLQFHYNNGQTFDENKITILKKAIEQYSSDLFENFLSTGDGNRYVFSGTISSDQDLETYKLSYQRQKKHEKSKSFIVDTFYDAQFRCNDETIKDIFININDKGRVSLFYAAKKEPAHRYFNTPTIILDGTAKEEVVKAFWPDIKYYNLKSEPHKNTKVIQLENISTSKKALEDKGLRGKIVSGIKLIIKEHEYKNPALITYKSISNESNFLENIADELGIKTINYFGNSRGLNNMLNCDAFFILGQNTIPVPDLFFRAKALFGRHVKNDDYIRGVTTPIRMRDGTAMGVKNDNYGDPYMQIANKHFNNSETIQAIGRARFLNEDKKTIYFLTNNSMGEEIVVDELIPFEILLDNPYRDQIEAIKNKGYIYFKNQELISIGFS